MLRTLIALLLAAGPLSGHDWNGLCIDEHGNVYVIDAEDGQIWRITRDGKVDVFVSGSNARQCEHPHHMVIDESQFIWLASG